MAVINNIYKETITFNNNNNNNNHFTLGPFRFIPHVDTLQSPDPIPICGELFFPTDF